MKMVGEQRIVATRAKVWQALNDVDVLRECIPGCQSLEKLDENRMGVLAEVRIGPIGARFKGAVNLSDLDPPNAYMISGEGQGGMAGFAKGAARVRLAAVGEETLLSYEVDAQVGGRLAQLGGPIIDAAAKQLADKFFAGLRESVEGIPQSAIDTQRSADAIPEPTEAPISVPVVQPTSEASLIAWLLALVVATLAGFLMGRSQSGSAGSDWAGLAIGLLLMVVFVSGFGLGRRTAAPAIDYARLVQLLESARK